MSSPHRTRPAVKSRRSAWPVLAIAGAALLLQGCGAGGSPVTSVVVASAGQGDRGSALRSAAKASCTLPAPAALRGAFPRTVRVGNGPDSLAVGVADAHVFAVAAGPTSSNNAYLCPGTVVMLDARTGAITHAIHVGAGPRLDAISESLHRLVVGNEGDYGKTLTSAQGGISMIDTRTGGVVATTPLGAIPDGILLSEAAGLVLVPTHPVHSQSDTETAVLDAATGKLLRTIPVAQTQNDYGVDPRSGFVLLSQQKKSLDVVDGRTGKVRSLSAAPCNGGTIFADRSTGEVALLGSHNYCTLDIAAGKVLRSMKNGCGADTFYQPPAARHLVVVYNGDKENSGLFCVLDLDTGKSVYSQGLNGASLEVLAIVPPAKLMIDTEADCFICQEGNYVRSTQTGKRVRKIKFNFDHVAADSQNGRLFFVGGKTMTAYDPIAWKPLFTQRSTTTISDEFGSARVVSSIHRVFVFAGTNPGGGLMTAFCTQADCK
jgi:DNA-binding beta-propeller fold protein YncE